MSRDAIGTAIEVHHLIGLGLLESIYEKCKRQEFQLRGIPVMTQDHVSIECKGAVFKEEFKLDLLVNSILLIEIKAV